MELQKHGLPPAEVIGDMPEEWLCDNSGVDNMNFDAFKKILNRTE